MSMIEEFLEELKKRLPRAAFRAILCRRNDHKPAFSVESMLDESWSAEAYSSIHGQPALLPPDWRLKLADRSGVQPGGGMQEQPDSVFRVLVVGVLPHPENRVRDG